ncbi:MAG: hypothetical protein WCC00_02935 [Candidatus Aminicenantales bacterium]
MRRYIGLLLLTLGSILLGASSVHFGLVTNVKDLLLLKRFLFWLRGGRAYWDSQQRKAEMMAEKGIPPSRHWRTEKTPTVFAVILILIGLALSL